MLEVDPELREDPRWQLIERITASPPFQKSGRMRELLRFLAARSIRGQIQNISEQRIGSAVFGKPQDYSVVEDSTVRVHVRQLRLKLHEYFDGEGRGETSVVEIPKGAYTPLFRSREEAIPTLPVQVVERDAPQFWLRVLPWVLAALFLVTNLIVWFHVRAVETPPAPWPLDTLFQQGNRPVQVVVADISYGMTRLVDEQQVTLEQYLSPDYRRGQMSSNAHPTPREARVTKYLSNSLLTSYADLVAVSTLIRISGNARDLLAIRSARDLRPRDLEQGGFVFIGSPSSNPWVSYFQDKLNFKEREGVVGESPKCFQNMHPKAGEQDTYCGLNFTGNSGEDYATISMLLGPNGRDSVLILQGLQQEGTEAAGLFLADASSRKSLQRALGITGVPSQPIYFEALIRTHAVAGAPNATSIIATRLLRP